ncbi:MAG: S46 family peptidase [Flavipsychrobacter sp.]|nr:S46 family peptidase [Flavipsychrobacter sp.]
MKKLLLSLAVFSMFFSARADEGMWIPMLIGKNYDEMVRLGLKLSKEDLYSINHSSLKDAVVQFAGGCTAEMISDKGLLLTNHHCGYDAIATLSTVQHDYLDNGFWAHNYAEELQAQGVTVIFLQKVTDVTAEVRAAVGNATGDDYNKKFDVISKQIEKRESNNGKLVANVREYFNGNQILLLTYKRYTDVRLVGTPPKSLGKFGGDTDNWMWPRHTSDFSMFRVYAGKNNEPAAYSADNVPYKPAKFLPVSIKGERQNDYAMIYGYPGRTNRYEVSNGVSLAVNMVNPAIVKIRDLRLSIMRKHMDADKHVYLQTTSLYARIANYWKYFIGQTEQLKRLKVVDEKKTEENKFTEWARQNAPQDANLMDKFANLYNAYTPYAIPATYYAECFRTSGMGRLGAALEPVQRMLTEHKEDSAKLYLAQLKIARRGIMKEYDPGTERDLTIAMTKLYYTDVPKDMMPDIYENVIFKKFGKDKAGKSTGDAMYTEYVDYMIKHTFVLDSNAFNAFCEAPTLEKISKDAAAEYGISFAKNYKDRVLPKVEQYNNDKKELAKTYVHDLMIWKKDKMFYPDANSTMRISYGQVKGYDPVDGVHYKYFTTLDGLMAKYKPGSDEFDVPADLIDLYNKKDYGRYADADGTLHTCFITNNDITGGNSGSPVINANGELIGAAFDGNWEAMSGDIAFDKKYKRTIVCDVRYILFLIDKMGKADNLIKEMDIRTNKDTERNED